MKFEDLKNVNEKLQTVDVKGKAYVQVNTRIIAFRELFPMGQITTEILSNENGVCLMKATITDGQDHVLGTGHAYEKETSSFINKTSYIENCETSAVGRALAMVGIGTDSSMCSAEELVNAITNQGEKDKSKKATTNDGNQLEAQIEETKKKKISLTKVKTLLDRINEDGISLDGLLRHYQVKTLENINEEQLSHMNMYWDDIKKTYGVKS